MHQLDEYERKKTQLMVVLFDPILDFAIIDLNAEKMRRVHVLD